MNTLRTSSFYTPCFFGHGKRLPGDSLEIFVDFEDSKDTGESGNTLIELALTLPVFLLMVFGFINFALVLYGACNVTYGSRMALRYASTHSSTSYVPMTTQQLTTMMNPYFTLYPANTRTVNLTYPNNNQNVGQPVCVNVSITYNIVLLGYTQSGPTVPTSACGVLVQ